MTVFLRTARLFIIFTILSVSGAPQPCLAQRDVYSGQYTGSFETSLFEPADSDEKWWAEGNLGQLANDGCYENVVLQGNLTSKGSYGHLGAYDRKLAVTKIIRLTKITCELIKKKEKAP